MKQTLQLGKERTAQSPDFPPKMQTQTPVWNCKQQPHIYTIFVSQNCVTGKYVYYFFLKPEHQQKHTALFMILTSLCFLSACLHLFKDKKKKNCTTCV